MFLTQSPKKLWVFSPFFPVLKKSFFYDAGFRYFYPMEDHYKTLQVIYDIIREEPNPETYKCRPREIILRQYLSWQAIEQNLKSLEEEGMVTIGQEDTMIICITAKGIEKIKSKRKFIHRP